MVNEETKIATITSSVADLLDGNEKLVFNGIIDSFINGLNLQEVISFFSNSENLDKLFDKIEKVMRSVEELHDKYTF